MSVYKPGLFNTPFYRHWSVGNVCEVSAKNIELEGSWSLSKFTNFPNAWFLENKRVLIKFFYGILHYLISIIKYNKNQSIKNKFYINHATHLKKRKFSISSNILNFIKFPTSKNPQAQSFSFIGVFLTPDPFLTSIWDLQAHQAPKMTFPQEGLERTFYMCQQTILGCQKSRNIKILTFFQVDLLIVIQGFHYQ